MIYHRMSDDDDLVPAFKKPRNISDPDNEKPFSQARMLAIRYYDVFHLICFI